VQLLKLRYFQARRDLGYWVIIFAAIAFGIAYSAASPDPKHSLIVVGLAVLGFSSFHSKRRDLHFIRKHFDSPLAGICFNYHLTVLPLSLGFLFAGYWYYALLLHILVTGICFFRIRTYTPRLLFVQKLVPPSQFEWIAGLRSNFPILVILAIIMIILSPVKLFAIAALFVFNVIILGFYSFFEPRIMLNPGQLSISKFLSSKVRFMIRAILITNLPILIVNSIFQPDVVWFNVFFLAGFLVMTVTGIYIKYAHYRPSDSLPLSFDYLVLLVSVFVPFLLPLSFFILFSNLKKAKNNLSLYLDDHS
jgi:hypothetical protein